MCDPAYIVQTLCVTFLNIYFSFGVLVHMPKVPTLLQDYSLTIQRSPKYLWRMLVRDLVPDSAYICMQMQTLCASLCTTGFRHKEVHMGNPCARPRAQDRSKTASRQPKTSLRLPQERPRAFQERPRSVPKASKRRPRMSKKRPGGAKVDLVVFHNVFKRLYSSNFLKITSKLMPKSYQNREMASKATP